MNNEAEELIAQIIEAINGAKHDIVVQLIEQIEGRPFMATDAENVVLQLHKDYDERGKYVFANHFIYRGINFGTIKVDSALQCVTFTPHID